MNPMFVATLAIVALSGLADATIVIGTVATTATAIRWRCELYQSKKCPGRMYANKNMNEVVSESKAVKHSHLL